MKQVFVVVLLVIGIQSIVYSQRTSYNDYVGAWESAASWAGLAPPVTSPGGITITNTHLDLTINGYITRTGSITVNGTTGSIIINDTLVVLAGNMIFNSNAAPLRIGPNGLVIVIGDVTFQNNTTIENDGIFVVTGNASFHNGANDFYDNSGGGELFVQGTVSNNNDAQGSNIWGQLNKYPVLHDFVMCKATGGTNCILPIKLSYFVAELQNDVVELRWATTMEENFRKFIVQRASNGMDYEDLGEVAGKGFDIYDIESKYAFEDKNPLTGFNYYRLKAVDLDDTFEYFGVKAVKVSAPRSMSVYPNPSAGDLISFSVNFNPGESDRIVLVDQLGVEVFSGPALVARNSISFENKLRPGVYMLRYVAKGFEQTTRLLVKN